MADTHPCTGYLESISRDDCCDAHRAFLLCGNEGPEFGLPDANKRREIARCSLLKGHDGPHSGFAFSVATPEVW